MKGIRILHAITRLDRGGSSANTLLSAIGLAEKGYSVDILFGRTEKPDEDLMERARAAGVRFIEQKSLLRNIHPGMDVAAFFRIFRLMRQNQYDIVHAHSHKAGLICRVAAKCAGIKKIVYTPHGHVFYGYFGRMLTALIILTEKMAAHITDRIVGLTAAEWEEWLRFGIGTKDVYMAVPSGIEFDRLRHEADKGPDWRKELGISPDKTVVGSIGRFIKIKGYEYFIEAAIEQIKKRKDVFFLLAGDGPLRERYRQRVDSAGVKERFFIIPWQQNTGAVIKALDMFVLSSLNEGQGRTLLEAMFFEKPVIATRVGGVPSVVSDGAGLLVEPASSPEISGAIDALLENTGNARRMAGRGREKALAGYSAHKMVDDLDKLYRELLGVG